MTNLGRNLVDGVSLEAVPTLLRLTDFHDELVLPRVESNGLLVGNGGSVNNRER